jgi:hypothetical protein
VGTSWNGDFSYRFSPADNNPTLTFIPSQSGVGTPTCILYYGTDPGSMPGYIVTPNVPYTINANKGTKIFFYYTYSFPGAGERNNSANKNSYVIGSCKNISVDEFAGAGSLFYYPNPVVDFVTIQLAEGKSNVAIYNATGQLVDAFETDEYILNHDMRHYATGLYVFRIVNKGHIATFKITKQAH